MAVCSVVWQCARNSKAAALAWDASIPAAVHKLAHNSTVSGVRPEVGWVAPLALQAFDAALQGHGLTFPVRSSTVTAHVPNSTIQVPAPM